MNTSTIDLPDAFLQRYVLPDGRTPRTAAELLDHLRSVASALALDPALFLGIKPQDEAKSSQAVRLLLDEGFLIRGRQGSPWPLTFPIDWAANPFADENWRSQLNSWRFLEPVMLHEHATGSAQSWRYAMRVVSDWLAFNVSGDAGRNAMAWRNRITGVRAILLLYMLWRLARRPSEPGELSDLSVLMVLLVEHFERLSTWDFLSETNHGIAQMHALKACSRMLPGLLPERGIAKICARALGRLMTSQFSSEGIHLEQSPAYHGYALRAFRRFVATGFYADEPELLALLRKARQHDRLMYHPNGASVRIGDSLSSYESITDPGNVTALFTPPAAPMAVTPASFPEAGYGIVKCPDGLPPAQRYCLFFSSAFHRRGHRHSDDMCIEWFDRGRALLVDSGKHGYDDGTFRDYALSTRAHNTLEIDGRDYSRHTDHAHRSGLRRVWSSPLGAVIHGRLVHRHFHDTLPPISVERDRIVIFSPNRWLLVADAVKAREKHRIVQWHHLAPDLVLGRRNECLDSNGRALMTVKTACSAATTWISGRGETTPRPLGWTTVAYGKSIPTTAFGLAARVSSGTIATLFLIGNEKGNVATNGPASVVLTVGDVTAEIRFAEEVDIHLGSTLTSRLRWRGRRLLDSLSPRP